MRDICSMLADSRYQVLPMLAKRLAHGVVDARIVEEIFIV